MGKSGSKPKKGGKKESGGSQEKPKEDAPTASPAKEEPAAAAAAASEPEEEEDPFENACVYSKDKQVGVEDFDLIAVIGKGSFGKVMQVKEKESGEIYAMKVLRKDAIIARKQVAHTKAEKSILQKIKHPFIVNLNYAFQTEDKLYMVLDYVNGGELFFHLKKEGKFSEERVRLYAAEIASALLHLHSFDIVYRDLKPENILLDSEGHICITDFGLSKEIKQDEGTHTFCGTPEYLAPEVLKGSGHGVAVDWWSLGTLIFEMLTGLPPFYSQNINIMYQKILHGELRFPPYISEAGVSLLEGLLDRDPETRLQGDAIKTHAFFAGLDWQDLFDKKIDPEFKPPVKSKDDISQIDTCFTSEQAVDSVVEGSAINTAEVGFEGFTYVGDSVLGE
eukprot:TRINITY_DN1252_c0_g1_i1.p1 TRINITY_DN1252_c0_g1~~TRINITY_DN1252_c0_g1_i1.p1  ORF type:complete len:424 (+),score=167.71 TRINITY_DN1252_c0_g1_i1:99-1274(+)